MQGGGEKFDFLPQQNLRKERDIWYKIKLIYSVLIKKISSLLSVGYYKSNNENQFKDIQLQLHATKVTNPYTFSIQGNKSFSGICELDKPTTYVLKSGVLVFSPANQLEIYGYSSDNSNTTISPNFFKNVTISEIFLITFIQAMDVQLLYYLKKL